MKNTAVYVAILVVGIVLLIMGFNEYDTFGSRATRMFGGGISNKVLFFFIAGAACTAYGLISVLKKK